MAYLLLSKHNKPDIKFSDLYFDIRASAVTIAKSEPRAKETTATGIVNFKPAINSGKKESLSIPIILSESASKFILSPFYFDTSLPKYLFEIFE